MGTMAGWSVIRAWNYGRLVGNTGLELGQAEPLLTLGQAEPLLTLGQARPRSTVWCG